MYKLIQPQILIRRTNNKMKNLFKVIFFLTGGVIWFSVLIFGIYTDLDNTSGYKPKPIEKELKRDQ